MNNQVKNTARLFCDEAYDHVLNLGKENEKRTSLGGGEAYETFATTLGELYRACQKQHGRCVSRVYLYKEGKVNPIGWVFLKKNPGEPEGDGTGVIETWVTVYTKPPVRRISWDPPEYPDFGKAKKV
jgi:hypothetical protein